MREIKFRAWEEGRKIHSLGYLADCLLTSQFVEDYGADLTRYEFMQFTGLCDKSGKEIYEGDILSDGRNFIEVKWEEYNYAWKVAYGIGFPLIGPPQRAEVIGNIYEKPQLLKA